MKVEVLTHAKPCSPELWEVQRSAFSYTPQEAASSQEEFTALISQTDAMIIVARDNHDAIIAFALAVPNYDKATSADDLPAYLSTIAVKPTEQSGGIGSQLFKETLSLLAKKQFRFVEMVINPPRFAEWIHRTFDKQITSFKLGAPTHIRMDLTE